MTSCYEIQSAYVDLYKQLRNYIWGFQVVDAIADLEIACYQSCPNLADVIRCLNKLSSEIVEVTKEDEDLKKSIDNMRKLLESTDSTYIKLNKVREVIPLS